MSMKFGLLTDVNLRKRVTSSDTKPEVGLVSSRRGRHIETVYDVISPPWVARFGRNLGICFRIVRKLLRSGQNCKGKNSIPTAIENRSLSYFFCFPNAVWASASGGFRIVSDTLVDTWESIPQSIIGKRPSINGDLDSMNA